MVGKHEYMNMGPRIYRVCYATGLVNSIFDLDSPQCITLQDGIAIDDFFNRLITKLSVISCIENKKYSNNIETRETFKYNLNIGNSQADKFKL